jgi:hypothetical protein
VLFEPIMAIVGAKPPWRVIDAQAPIHRAPVLNFHDARHARADADRVLDAVHDAVITACGQASEGEEDNVAMAFQRLLGEFAGALRGPVVASSDASYRISSEDMRQLRRDLITELRFTISLRGNPSSWLAGRRILHELRVMRRRVRLTLNLGAAERIRIRVL